MTTALARRNAWMRQLRRLRENCDRHLEQQEPEGKFKASQNIAHNVAVHIDNNNESESH
jgi:hypothetical protein